MDRRAFLKGVGGVVAGSGLAGAVKAERPGKSLRAQGKIPMVPMVTVMGKSLPPQYDLVTVAGGIPPCVRPLIEGFGDADVYGVRFSGPFRCRRYPRITSAGLAKGDITIEPLTAS